MLVHAQHEGAVMSPLCNTSHPQSAIVQPSMISIANEPLLVVWAQAQHERAVEAFRRALRLNPNYLSAWTLMGHEYVELHNASAAIGKGRGGGAWEGGGGGAGRRPGLGKHVESGKVGQPSGAEVLHWWKVWYMCYCTEGDC